MIQTLNDGYLKKKELGIEEHEKNVARVVKNSLELKVCQVKYLFVYIRGDVSCLFTHYYLYFINIFKVALVLDKPKLLIMARNLLPIKELFLKVHNLRNYPRVQDKPIENLKVKARRKVEKTVFKKYFFRNKNIYHHIHKLILYIYLEFVTFSSKT